MKFKVNGTIDLELEDLEEFTEHEMYKEMASMTLDQILLKYVLKDKVENLCEFKYHDFNQYQSSENYIQSRIDKYVIYADAIHQYLEMCENAKDE